MRLRIVPTGPVEASKASQASRQSDLLGIYWQIHQFMGRFVVLPAAAQIAVVLWVMHAHFIEASIASPILHIVSPIRQSGKTRLLEVLAELTPKSWLTSRTSTAALMRKIDKDKPTLLLDESDQLFLSNSEYVAAITALLNSGHRRGQKASISVPGVKGGWEVKDFECYCPKAIAGIQNGTLPDTVADRAICIEMERRDKTIEIERWRHRDHAPQAEAIKDFLAEIATDTDLITYLLDVRPELPKQLSDRQGDVWEPLLAIADYIGLGDDAREALQKLTVEKVDPENDKNLGIQLLVDLKGIFDEEDKSWLSTKHILYELVSDDMRPWQTFSNGKELTTHALGGMLRNFRVYPSRTVIGDSRNRGYSRTQVDDAAKRLLPNTKD